jgi:hypothetical protein
MSQTSYPLSLVKGLNGSKADSRFDFVESMQALGNIPVGRGVSKVYGNDTQVTLPVENNVVILDDAGTFTAGSIATTINGTVVTTNWITDKNTTMTAHAAAIQAAAPAGVYSAVHSTGSHTITIKSSNATLVVTVSVAGVTGTMTISSITASSINTFAGIAINSGTIEQTSAGVVQYTTGMAVCVLRQGAAYILPEEVVTSDDAVYFRIQINGAKLPGMFGKSADSGKCIVVSNARWVESGTTTTVAKLELLMP